MSELANSSATDRGPLKSSGAKQWTEGDVEILTFNLAALTPFERLRVSYKCTVEGEIAYAALGFRYPSGFHHIKQKHVLHDRVMTLDLSPDDLIFLMESGWQVPDGETAILELWIKFKEPSSGTIDLVSVERVEVPPLELDRENLSEKIEKLIADALNNSGLIYNNALELAEMMIAEPVLAISGDTKVPLTLQSDFVGGYETLGNSQRYMYHSLGHVRIFLIAFEQTGRTEFLSMARLWTERWWRANYVRQPDDLKYSYYDHGTAERTLVLCRLASLMVRYECSKVEIAQLLAVLNAHLRLLASWGFVSRHQPIYIHNHAIFQAIALLAGGMLLSHHAESESWKAYGARLLHDQVSGLLTDEGASIENSSGYQISLQRILENVMMLLRPHLAHLPRALLEVRQLTEAMSAFSERLPYCPQRQSALGDSDYARNRSLKRVPPPRLQGLQNTGELWVLDKAGYASLISRLEGDREMTVVAIASSLSNTHKQDDDLHFTIGSSDGVEWIADPGFYAYDQSEAALYAKSPAAHNAPQIDMLEYERRPGNATMAKLEADDGWIAFRGEHRNYIGAQVRRTWLWSKDDLGLLVRDEIRTDDQGEKKVDYNWTLGDGVTASPAEAAVALSYPDHPFLGPTLWTPHGTFDRRRDGRVFPNQEILETERLALQVMMNEGAATVDTVIIWDGGDPAAFLDRAKPMLETLPTD